MRQKDAYITGKEKRDRKTYARQEEPGPSRRLLKGP